MTDQEIIKQSRHSLFASPLSDLAVKALKAHQWNSDMDAAPHNGARVLACAYYGKGKHKPTILILRWNKNYETWVSDSGDFWQATHWKHLIFPEDVQ